jgi:hypothetical protein
VLVGLNKRTTSEKLHEAFAKFGEVDNGNVIFLNGIAFHFWTKDNIVVLPSPHPLSLSLHTHIHTSVWNFVEHALKILAM